MVVKKNITCFSGGGAEVRKVRKYDSAVPLNVLLYALRRYIATDLLFPVICCLGKSSRALSTCVSPRAREDPVIQICPHMPIYGDIWHGITDSLTHKLTEYPTHW